jgi:hypothetical protein
VDGLEICQLVVIGVNTCAEEQACVPTVYDLVVAKLDEVGLVFLIARSYKTVDLRTATRDTSLAKGNTGESELASAVVPRL